MSSPPPDLSVTPPYQPAPYLISGPGAFLNREELVRYFEDFHSSLACVNTAPQMVFERLIGNLSLPVQAAIRKARRSGTREDSVAGVTSLQVPVPAVSLPTALPPPVPVPVPAVSRATNLVEDVRQTPPQVIGSFSAEDCSEWDATSAFEYTKAFVSGGTADLSRFAIALTSFQMPDSAQLIASASITTPLDTGYSVALSNSTPTGSSSRLKSASCSWIELGEHTADMQCGVWSLSESQGSYERRKSTSHKITFPMRYDQKPQVLVWLRGLHMWTSLDRFLELRVVTGTSSGFRLEVIAPTGSPVPFVEISWLACPVPRPGVIIGHFHAGKMSSRPCDGGLCFPVDNCDDYSSWTKWEGYVAFKSGWFKAPPRVAVGITGFEIASRVCLSVQVVQVTTEGMKWRIDGGKDSNITAATGSFIAIE